MILMITGQPASGKTTLAQALKDRGIVDAIVDGDDLRELDNPGYDEAGRRQNIDRGHAIARQAGRDCACPAIRRPAAKNEGRWGNGNLHGP